MSAALERAHSAQRLKDDSTFQDVLKEVKEQQVAVFLDANAGPLAREEAHVIIRALDKIESEIDARTAEIAFAKTRKSAP